MEHENAQILRAIADGNRVQYRHRRLPLGWETLDNADSYMCCKLLAGSDIYEWRIAPKTINIAQHEVPEPHREPLEEDTVYWTFTPFTGVVRIGWYGTKDDYNALKSGFVHLTKEAAEAHYEAIKSFSASTK